MLFAVIFVYVVWKRFEPKYRLWQEKKREREEFLNTGVQYVSVFMCLCLRCIIVYVACLWACVSKPTIDCKNKCVNMPHQFLKLPVR